MGVANSRSAENGPLPQSGVRITRDLLLQLSGKEEEPTQPAQTMFRMRQMPPTFRRAPVVDAVEQAIQQDQQLQSALATSKRVGNLLLKHEDEERHRVESYAQQLLDHEYRAPARQPPCREAEAACLQCYRQHPEDPLKCAAAVEAYSQCSRQAFAAALG